MSCFSVKNSGLPVHPEFFWTLRADFADVPEILYRQSRILHRETAHGTWVAWIVCQVNISVSFVTAAVKGDAISRWRSPLGNLLTGLTQLFRRYRRGADISRNHSFHSFHFFHSFHSWPLGLLPSYHSYLLLYTLFLMP